MIFDIIFAVVPLAALFTGYKNGLITTIIRTIFFIAGAIGAPASNIASILSTIEEKAAA